jgi:molecular chaperone DnaK
MGRAIGIDLGTTNSVVAFVNDAGQPEVISSREGGRTIPSVFAVADGEKLVGKPAVDQEAMNAKNTIRSIKRHMGTHARFDFAGMGKPLSPEEISAEILKKIKADAEAFLGESVTDAVITVPAYFNNDQRQATKTAGELAGLNVLRIINEPTAAALAYGLDRNINQTVLVYDLGGGTFDVTVLKIADGMDFLVQSTKGDTHLGGDDFDADIEKLILTKADLSLALDDAMRARLREAAEQAKKELSAAQTAHINIPYLAFENNQPVHVKVTLTRQEMESAIAPLLERTKRCVEAAIRDAGLTFKDIDEVVFVGGSTRVPKVAEEIEAWTGKRPNRSINPDEAVGIGAAIQASILSGQSNKLVFLVDVTPLSLGVETQGGVMDVLIRRNTHVPAEASQVYTTAFDRQSSVDVRVFQGERPQTKDNRLLGEFKLDGIPDAPRGTPQIEVTFEIDANGILSVRACDKVTGIAQTVTLTGNASLTAEEVQRMLEDAEQNKTEDSMFVAVTNLQAVIRDQTIQVEELLRTTALDDAMRAELIDLKESLEQAQDSTQLELMNALAEAAKQTLQESSEAVYRLAEQLVCDKDENARR